MQGGRLQEGCSLIAESASAEANVWLRMAIRNPERMIQLGTKGLLLKVKGDAHSQLLKP